MPNYLGIGAGYVAIAVVAHKLGAFGVAYVEACGHWLVVGDALRVGATHYGREHRREFHWVFRHHGVVADDVDRRGRSHDGYAVECGAVEFHAVDFDDSLSAEAAAGEVVAYGHAVGHLVDAEDMRHFEKCVGGNMVDHSAGGKGRYGKFGFLLAHFCKGFMPKALVIMA